MDEPEGGLETLAVEMLGLTTGLPASPGSRVFFYFFVIPNKIHNNENEQ